ncbi:DNA-directed RNA polymerase [Lipomyces oligophaga]|uniref:DNA-directed RNA polymerase n=1 Tax=Lipomyces oligophaga TaxID=45792 RepID=UPI0034CE78D3
MAKEVISGMESQSSLNKGTEFPAEENIHLPLEEIKDDAVMQDAEEFFDSELDTNKIQILPGASEDGTAASFRILQEDHTLGNALRYIIMKNPEVEFCGYSIPHPSEAAMNLRIQTYGEVTAVQALEKGLDDLMALCDVVEDSFRSVVETKDYSRTEP